MAHQPFHGSVPNDRLYCLRYDMWVQMQDNGDVLIGATSFGIFLAGEIIARIAEKAFYDLDAPPARVCSAEVPIPYAKHLEDAALPSVERIVASAHALFGASS